MKFQVGDKIPVSAIVEITGISITKNDKAVYSTDHGFAVCESTLEQISIKGREKPIKPVALQPEPIPAPNPIKLYCVKEEKGWLTNGKVYEFVNGDIQCDRGGYKVGRYSDYGDFCKYNESLASCLFPLVHRPAKVGEWVLPVAKVDGAEEGKIYPVLDDNWSHLKDSIRVCEWGKGGILNHNQYLVLDGYKGDIDDNERKIIARSCY